MEIPPITTYVLDDGTTHTRDVRFSHKKWVDITNQAADQLIIGRGIEKIYAVRSQLKSLYIPPTVKQVWVDADVLITNLVELVDTEIEIHFISEGVATDGRGLSVIIDTNLLRKHNGKLTD